MLKLTMTAAIATTLMAPSAFALPTHQSAGADATAVQRVQYREHDHRYEPGSRIRQAPRGWHRYHARPRDWRDRGCVIVGPVWFCP